MQRIDILWRDIPSQVLIKRGRDRGKYMLTARFQEAIDRAAMRAGKAAATPIWKSGAGSPPASRQRVRSRRSRNDWAKKSSRRYLTSSSPRW